MRGREWDFRLIRDTFVATVWIKIFQCTPASSPLVEHIITTYCAYIPVKSSIVYGEKVRRYINVFIIRPEPHSNQASKEAIERCHSRFVFLFLLHCEPLQFLVSHVLVIRDVHQGFCIKSLPLWTKSGPEHLETLVTNIVHV